MAPRTPTQRTQLLLAVILLGAGVPLLEDLLHERLWWADYSLYPLGMLLGLICLWAGLRSTERA
jgi:hypothetical protein